MHTAKLHRFYFDWTMMANRAQKSFIGTIPVNIFYGLRESIRLLDEEGLDNVIARHTRLARGDPARGQGLGREQRPDAVLRVAGSLFRSR